MWLLIRLNKEIRKHLYDEYPNKTAQKRLEMEQKELLLMRNMEKRWNKE